MSSLMIVTRYFPPTRNGLADHSMLLVNCLKNDFEKIVVVHEEQKNTPTVDNALGSGDPRINSAPFRDIYNVRRTVMRAIEEHRPDVVLLQYVPHMWGRAGIAPQIALLAFEVRSKMHVPLVSFVHEMYYDWSWSLRRSVASLIHRLQLFAIGSFSHRVFVTNEFRRQILSRIWSDKVARIPAGNVSARKPNELRQQVFAWPYILWYGTLSEGQLLEELCTAFCKVAPKFPSLRLVLVGGFDVLCERMTHLQKSCADDSVTSRIVVYGFAEDEQLSDLISGSELNLHVNHSGPSGRRTVIAAYLRSGRPMVCIDGRETDPEFRHMDNVLLVPAGHPRMLAEAIETLLSDQNLASKLVSSANSLFQEHFSDEAVKVMVMAQTCRVLQNPIFT